MARSLRGFAHSYQRMESSNSSQRIKWHQSRPLMVDPVYKVSCPGDTEAETAGCSGLPGAGVRCIPCMCVCVRALRPAPKFFPHYPHCLRRRPESTKEDLKPLPLTLQAARVPYSSAWQANMGSVLPTGAGCAGQDTSLPSVFIHIRRPYSLRIVLPWRPLGLSLRLVYTDVYLPRACKCRGGSSRQLTPGKPIGKSPGVANITIWSDPSLMEPAETFPWMRAMAVHWATCMLLMENRTVPMSPFYKGFLSGRGSVFTPATCFE